MNEFPELATFLDPEDIMARIADEQDGTRSVENDPWRGLTEASLVGAARKRVY